MRLLYVGGSQCSVETLKRLMLVGSDICFSDRPSVAFKNWGTVGHSSALRRLSTDGEAIKISVLDPPGGPAPEFYQPYVEADLANPEFVRLCIGGIAQQGFAHKFVAPAEMYGETRGSDLLVALNAHPNLSAKSSVDLIDVKRFFDIKSKEGIEQTFTQIVVDASIAVTAALFLSEEHDVLPATDDKVFSALLATRSGSREYVGPHATLSPFLGLEFAQAVIPDEALEHLSLADILEYRRATDDVYRAWTIEIDRVAAQIGTIAPERAADLLPKLMATELRPKIVAYEQEMRSARDRLFADLIGRAMMVAFPALSVAHVMNSAALAIAAFASAAVPRLISQVADEKSVERRHSVSYLVNIARRLDKPDDR